MTDECDVQLLSAYHDGELTDADRTRVEAHLRECDACSVELADIRESSRLLRSAPFDELTRADLDNLHGAIDDADDFRVWRVGASLGLVAASILVIGMAWLNALPSRTAAPIGGGGAVATTATTPASQSWERTAVTLRVYPPLPAADHSIQSYDAQLADYMLEGLALGK
jgi:anti-sigma factor RsiW